MSRASSCVGRSRRRRTERLRGKPSGRAAHASAWWLLVPLVLGALVACGLGLLARQEAVAPGTYPGGWYRLFFSDTLHLKAWFASAAAALACLQLLTAAWIFRKLPLPRPWWIPGFHRWTGRLAFLCTIPVAYHCIFKLGFQKTDTRVAVHSFFGCAVYGAFAARVTILRMHRFRWWVLPLAGAALFTALIGVWWTSALWFFRMVGVGV